MMRIALVQNQSEMAHYGYADARPLISGFGYDVTLYTADNIDTLSSSLARGHYDAVVFGSNSLNDKTIRTETRNEIFINVFREWLKKGHGCLCLHQLKLATLEESNLCFLPQPLDLISAQIRPETEKSAEGEIQYSSAADDHILLLYPNTIEPSNIKSSSLKFSSLPGLYWHSWHKMNLSDWEVLLVDGSMVKEERPLLISVREPCDYRVVVTSLALDWHKQHFLLQNILTYVVEGRHNTAILLDADNRSTAFDYFLGTLRSRKYPYKSYFLGQEHSSLINYIKNGVHSILVIGPFVRLDKLAKDLVDAIHKRVISGNLKLVSIEDREPEVKRFSVAGRERIAMRLLYDTELMIQAELGSGYIDGSFWSTAETLQSLRAIKQATGDYGYHINRVLELAKKNNDRDGSYDEVFGVTCALLWIRGIFLGVGDKETINTLSWINARISRYDSREKILAYLTLADLKILKAKDNDALVSLLVGIAPEQLSEIDLVYYLRAALISNHKSIMSSIVIAIDKKQSNGAWIDLATTATVITALIDTLSASAGDTAMYSDLKAKIEPMVFKGIIHIQESLESSLEAGYDTNYPWDGKASTTIKCIQAWLKFEELIDLPIHELVSTLTGYSKESMKLFSSRQALSVLEDIKYDNTELRRKVANIEKDISIISDKRNSANKKARRYMLAIAPLLLALYILVSIIIDISINGGTASLLSVLKSAFTDKWAFHLALLAAIAAYLGLPWRKLFERYNK